MSGLLVLKYLEQPKEADLIVPVLIVIVIYDGGNRAYHPAITPR